MCEVLKNKNCYILHILLFVTYCGEAHAANTADYAPRSAHSSSTDVDAEHMAIALPKGFRPQAPPFKPMLLPFATPAPSSPFGGWRPIVGAANAPTYRNTMPPPKPLAPPPLAVLQDRMDTATQEQNLAEPLLESIVYGTWKPERPLGPNETPAPTRRVTTPATPVHNHKGQPPNAFEELFVQHPIVNVQPGANDVILFMKNGSRRIGGTRAPHTATVPTEFISVNMSDQRLLEMAKQINDSFGEIAAYTHKPKKTTLHEESEDTTQDVGIENESAADVETKAETENLALDVSKVWPTDFIVSVEKNSKQNSTPTISNRLSAAKSDEMTESLNGLSLPNALLPQISLNITKVGVPYEKQSSAENPTICVPLTVLEQLNQVEVLEVERVYCFPLPPTHKRHTGTPKPKVAIAKVENFTEYEAINASNMLNWSSVMITSSYFKDRV
ncbi:PREDICTED: uncharacterized protein LOC108978909 [Bactrocera latifrons]|uniref:uncharacterized protein LOC108978909 n=1 Tax=Bactrocera latifrons TaxID=174628 RepID=UPI0008DD6E91|nr:PREDICTED: uncharacterized protein LOC108978909 [Bactrocera latifrons]